MQVVAQYIITIPGILCSEDADKNHLTYQQGFLLLEIKQGRKLKLRGLKSFSINMYAVH
jgi:hypothetical protein